jgi:hypothetical protein
MEKNDLTQKLYEELYKRGLYEQEEEEEDDDEESDEENEDETEGNVSDDFCELTCMILHSRTQAHVFHLGVTGDGSYATHKALNDYYDGVIGLYDGLVESYQGKYGILKDFKTYKIDSFKNIKQVISYFENLVESIEENRDCCDDSYIQNQIDTVQELIYSTLYKLKYLK